MPRRRAPRRDGPEGVDGGAATRLVYSTDAGTPAAGPPPPEPSSALPVPRSAGAVRVRLERRASDRVVTIVTGLPGTKAQVEDLAGELRALCGAGGTARDGQVELQGDQRDKIAAALAARGLRIKR
jgi:translation initiation factor 1